MPHKCDTCMVGFDCKGQLERHLKTTSHKSKIASTANPDAPRPHSCQPCNFVGRTRYDLKVHEKTAAHAKKMEQVKSGAPSDKKYFCRPRGFGTNDRLDFTRHEATKRHVIVSGNLTGPTWHTCEPCEFKAYKKIPYLINLTLNQMHI